MNGLAGATATLERRKQLPHQQDGESPTGRFNSPTHLSRRSSDHTWLTADEAAHYLGLRSRMALYQAVRRGQIPAHHLGRRLRFRRSELDALLSSAR